MPILAITFLMFLTFVFFPNSINRVFFESDIGLELIAILMALKLRKIHWSVSLMFLLSVVSCIIMIHHQNVYAGNLIHDFLPPISFNAQLAFRVLLSFGALPFLLEDKYFLRILFLLYFTAVTDSIYMIIKTIIWGEKFCFALLSNSAMDASFIACLLPMSFQMITKGKYKKLGLFSFFSMCIAIVLSKSSTGIAALGVASAAYLLIEYGKKSIKYIATLAALLSGVAWIYLRDELLNPNGRYSIWNMDLRFFWHETHRAIGAGAGTFFFWGPEIQKIEEIKQLMVPCGMECSLSCGLSKEQAVKVLMDQHREMSLFVWMHNSWLQIIFEMGIVGFAGIIILYYFLINRSWSKKNYLFPILVTYGFIGLTQMPLQVFMFQILGICLIILSFQPARLKNN